MHRQTGAALLLPRLPGGRRHGPVFLASRKPACAVAAADLCPVTGRARLSYRRAAEVFAGNPAFRHTGKTRARKCQVADEWCLAASYEWRITTGPAGELGLGTSLAVAAVLSELAAVPCRRQLAGLRVRTSPVRT